MVNLSSTVVSIHRAVEGKFRRTSIEIMFARSSSVPGYLEYE